MNFLCDDNTYKKGNLLVLSGPSGVGKGTICRKLLEEYPHIVYSVSATTRKARPGEVHGRDYFFLSDAEFMRLVEEDAFLEWAQVFEHYYGTPVSFVQNVINQGKDCILEIDVQGALQVKEKYPKGVFIFIVPPSMEELVRRITCRGTEDNREIDRRMEQAERELQHVTHYDYLVINDDLKKAVKQVYCIITAEKCRIKK